jgi:1-acyl-sn-glycerol-3-phosphate acyltransferase
MAEHGSTMDQRPDDPPAAFRPVTPHRSLTNAEEWRYDPATELKPGQGERLKGFPHAPGMLVGSVRSVAAVVMRGWLHTYHRLTIVGRENLPTDRSFLLIANHASRLDALCLLSALPLRQLHRAFPVAARDYFFARPRRAFLVKVILNALPFDRRFDPWECLSVCAHLLQNPGNILIFFPEGTRSGGREPRAFKPGVGLLAAGRDLPVVPCHLSGTQAALPKGDWFPRPRSVRLTIGAPRNYAHLPATRESARVICRELRETVISLGHGE